MTLTLHNETGGMVVGTTLGLDPDGRERIVVLVKSTYRLPDTDGDCVFAAEQQPLAITDTFADEPGQSPPVLECDYAPYKPQCDVLLHGRAYAPGGKPTSRVCVRMSVGALTKAFDVVGDRRYVQTSGGFTATEPRAFRTMPITYDKAFGGIDRDGARVESFGPNPCGIGWFPLSPAARIEGKPLPNTEATSDTSIDPKRAQRPLAFGPVGRSWAPRANFAGTYDQEWLDERFPLLPRDFDAQYHQMAPLDQQIPWLQGGEEVVLENLTPTGLLRFRLPDLTMSVVIETHDAPGANLVAVADTLVFLPDDHMFTVTFRASLPLRRDIFEVKTVLIGRRAS